MVLSKAMWITPFQQPGLPPTVIAITVARKNLANAKLGVRIDDASKLTLIFNSVESKADDPGGLTESEWQVDPQQSPRAEQFDTRKPSSRPVRDCAMNASLARRMISAS